MALKRCRYSRCNLHNYALHREPWFFKDTEFMIDQFHAKNHVDCSCNYNTAEYKTRVRNFSLAEQKNRPLAAAATSFSYMDQVTFLMMLRFKLACMNLCHRDHMAGSTRVFWKLHPEHQVVQDAP